MPEFSGTRTIAAAGDYAAGDVISDDADNGEGTALVVDPIARANSEELVLTHGVITGSVDALVFSSDLDIFTENPSGSELDDNAVAGIVVADRLKWVGSAAVPALADKGGFSGAEFTCYIPFRLVDTKSLWVIHRTRDAFTNESAGMTLTYRLFAEPVH